MRGSNIWIDEWDEGEDWSRGGGRSRRLPRGDRLGATVYELDPGNFTVYHFHHAWEEMLIVLEGQPTLRTDAGERRLGRGDVVFFRLGPEGVHGLKNETQSPVRFLMASSLDAPDVVEYPDLKQITVQARTGSQTGDRLWLIHDLD